MSRPSADYTRCPACRHRTVLFHFGKGGEDYFACGYNPRFAMPCGWETFAEPEGWDTRGRERLAAWQALNPTHDGDKPMKSKNHDHQLLINVFAAEKNPHAVLKP